MNNQAKPVDGARSVYRALQLLDLVAHHHEDGIGLAELVTLTGLDRTTVYRLASTLERENLLERDTDSRRYHSGHGIHADRADHHEPRSHPGRLCAGDESHRARKRRHRVPGRAQWRLCSLPSPEEGAFPIRTVTQHVGGLRLLGLGTAGQALLATLPDKEINAIQHRHRVEYEARGLPSEQLMETVARARRQGHAKTVDIITPGVCGWAWPSTRLRRPCRDQRGGDFRTNASRPAGHVAPAHP